MFGENLSKWLGRRVQDFRPGVKIQNIPDNPIFRIRSDYGDDEPFHETLKRAINSGLAESADALIIGLPGDAWEGDEAFTGAAKFLISSKSHFTKLRALFFGDFTYEECECSWANQTDAGNLLAEFPALEHFAIRGAGISFSPVRHICLESLCIQTGGLSKKILTEQLPQSVFPELKKLHIMTGDSGYGWDGNIDDIKNFLENLPFPSVVDLGILNAERGDDLCKAIVDSGVLDKIEALDLSMGTVGEIGANHLLDSGKLDGLKSLTIDRHYIPEKTVARLQECGAEKVSLSDYEGDDEPDDRYVSVGE